MNEYLSGLFHVATILDWLKSRSHWDQGNGIEVVEYDDLASDFEEFAMANRRPNQTRFWAAFDPKGQIVIDSITKTKAASVSKVVTGKPYLTEAHLWADWRQMKEAGWSCRQIEWVIVEEEG